jgi:hypothetical protein
MAKRKGKVHFSRSKKYVLKKGKSGKMRYHKKGNASGGTSEPRLSGGMYTKSGKRYYYSPRRDAKSGKAKRKGRAWRGDTHYSKKYGGWV